MLQKSPDENKAVTVTSIHFAGITKFPGISGASNTLTTQRVGTYANSSQVDSIFLYRGEFCVNGRLFVPKSAVLAYEF